MAVVLIIGFNIGLSAWTDTGGGVSSYIIISLAYDSGHNILYAGTGGYGVWEDDGTIWTNTGGGVSSDEILSLTYDSVHNLLYAGERGYGVWKDSRTSTVIDPRIIQ